jgi:hypothetical protein
MSPPSIYHRSPSPSASHVNPSDALTDDATSGQPLGDIPEGHEAAVEPIGADPAGADPAGADPAGADPVGADGVPPTPTQMIVTSESTGSSADVSVYILSASDVNN